MEDADGYGPVCSGWKGVVWVPPVEDADGDGWIQDNLQRVPGGGGGLRHAAAVKAELQALVSEAVAERHVDRGEQLAHDQG